MKSVTIQKSSSTFESLTLTSPNTERIRLVAQWSKVNNKLVCQWSTSNNNSVK
ncbi:hypothetical protein NIES4106_01900 [Fischerella sp. NIES-4106]|jgi:hypothetical protein|nr:hypothetical protein NIES4106_01900 [Fischerella sp. NIES-4106]